MEELFVIDGESFEEVEEQLKHAVNKMEEITRKYGHSPAADAGAVGMEVRGTTLSIISVKL